LTAIFKEEVSFNFVSPFNNIVIKVGITGTPTNASNEPIIVAMPVMFVFHDATKGPGEDLIYENSFAPFISNQNALFAIVEPSNQENDNDDDNENNVNENNNDSNNNVSDNNFSPYIPRNDNIVSSTVVNVVNTTPTWNVSANTEPGMETVPVIEISGRVINNQVNVNINNTMVRNALTIAQEADSNDDITVIIDVKSSRNIKGLTASIAGTAIRALNRADANVVINAPNFNATFDSIAISELSKQSNISTVTFAASPLTRLSREARAVFGSRPVFDFSIKDSRGIVIGLDDIEIKFSIPYTPARNENPENLNIFMLVDGRPVLVEGAIFKDGMLEWHGNPNAIYGVGYIN
jgi:hypothetical protein